MTYKLIITSLPAAMQWESDDPNKCKSIADTYYPRQSCEVVDIDGSVITSRTAVGSWAPMHLPTITTDKE